MDQFVVCVERERPGDAHSRVVAIGVASSPRATARETLSVEEAVHRRQAGVDQFFTERADGMPNEVFPHVRDGRFYLTTDRDGAEVGNIGALSECGLESPLALYFTRALTAPDPDVAEEPVRAVDLGLDHFVVAAVGFRDESTFEVVSLATLTAMALHQVRQFLARLRGFDGLGQDAATMAESFRNYQIGGLARPADSIQTVHSWPDARLRILVDLCRRDDAGFPATEAFGATLVDGHGAPWNGQSTEDVRIRWRRVAS